MSLKDKIRAKTKRNEGNSIEFVIASLNPTLRGWYGYFQNAHRYTFSTLDGFIRRRLRAMLRRQKHRPGQGRCERDHKQWPNAYFANLGLLTMSETHREVLVTLIEAYEQKHYPIGPADPVEAFKFRMEQQNLTPKDLEPYIGSGGRVSEVLNRKRRLSLQMVKKLHAGLHIPYESLMAAV